MRFALPLSSLSQAVKRSQLIKKLLKRNQNLIKRKRTNGLSRDLVERRIATEGGFLFIDTLRKADREEWKGTLNDIVAHGIESQSHQVSEFFSTKIDKESVLSEPMALRFALWQLQERCADLKKRLIVVLPANREEVDHLIEKVCIALDIPVIEILGAEKTHKRRGTARANLFSQHRSWSALKTDISLSPATERREFIRNLCFINGLPVSDGTYVLLRQPCFEDKEAWNGLVRTSMASASSRGANLIIFENSNQNTIFAKTFDAIARGRNVSLIGGELIDSRFMKKLLKSGRVVVGNSQICKLENPTFDADFLPNCIVASREWIENEHRTAKLLDNTPELLKWLNNLASPKEDYSASYKEYVLSGTLNTPIALTASTQNTAVTEGYQRYITEAFGSPGRLVAGDGRFSSISGISHAAAFMQWGSGETKRNLNLFRNSRVAGGPLFFVEDGFVRSVTIGLGGNPGLSFLIDDLGPYYDARRWSRIEAMLASDWTISNDELEACRRAMDAIQINRISKYNHAPDTTPSWASTQRRKVLLIDQRFGDQSVPSGLATEDSFRRMVIDAISAPGNPLVILKRHPDGTIGGKGSYFSRAVQGALLDHPNVMFHDNESNPHALFEHVDEVWCVTSGMGFEALMANKPVRVYGAPFYSGWGLTHDTIKMDWRRKKRTVEDLFFWAYLASTVYYRPDADCRAPLTSFCEYIATERAKNFRESA
ncbi:hypothetical protein I6F11_27675 [Ensifer sp. NBAIM29]|nr:hypothetical protein [Ensifer sp. NBAIM29]